MESCLRSTTFSTAWFPVKYIDKFNLSLFGNNCKLRYPLDKGFGFIPIKKNSKNYILRTYDLNKNRIFWELDE